MQGQKHAIETELGVLKESFRKLDHAKSTLENDVSTLKAKLDGR